jgi:hypothetical protein
MDSGLEWVIARPGWLADFLLRAAVADNWLGHAVQIGG